jgi:hypothetical protein
MRDKLLSVRARFLRQYNVSNATRLLREDRGEDHSNTAVELRSRPAPLLRSIAQLSKVFTGGFQPSMDYGIKGPLQNLGGFDGVIHAVAR